MKIYLTEKRIGPHVFGSEVEAHSWEEAAAKASIGGEIVIGELIESIGIDSDVPMSYCEALFELKKLQAEEK